MKKKTKKILAVVAAIFLVLGIIAYEAASLYFPLKYKNDYTPVHSQLINKEDNKNLLTLRNALANDSTETDETISAKIETSCTLGEVSIPEKINSDDLAEKLLEAFDLTEKTKTIKNENIITFHESYDYLASEYGFNVIATVESHEGGEPSAKGLAELVDVIEEHNVNVLFTEPDYKGSSATVLSSETGAEICTLNPVIRGEQTLTAYEDIMRENIEIILNNTKNNAKIEWLTTGKAAWRFMTAGFNKRDFFKEN